MLTLFARFSCASLFVFSLITTGCLTPKTLVPDIAGANKAESRENVMLKSKIGQAPRGAGIDPRARSIESSLGVR